MIYLWIPLAIKCIFSILVRKRFLKLFLVLVLLIFRSKLGIVVCCVYKVSVSTPLLSRVKGLLCTGSFFIKYK